MSSPITNPNSAFIDFPLQLTPVPDAADILYSSRTGEIRPPQMEIRSQLLPQKLRPIRCNGRTFPDYSHRSLDESCSLEGTLLRCETELGFLNQLSLENGGSDEYCGSVFGGPLVNVPAMQQINTEMDAEREKLISEGRLFEAGLSSSDVGDSSAAMKEPLYRKRKRKMRKKIELYVENMMRKVIRKQEQMHNQLIKMIENNERERIIREEAWQQQEIERAKKDEELREKERSRSLALISFIQNFLDCEIQIPKSWESLCTEKEEVKQNQTDLMCDPCNKRWPKSEVQALITVRAALDLKFFTDTKCILWEEVAVGLSNMGYSWSAKKCKEKWENINKYYKRTMEAGKKHPDNVKSCPYFHELDILYKSGFLSPGNDS